MTPFILYSFILAHILSTITKYIFLPERNIKEFKNEGTRIYDNEDKVKRCLVIKYICFFLFGFLFLIFLWFYLSSFGAVYKNTQLYLIKNTLISFCLSLLNPFILNLIPCFFRIYSLKQRKSKISYKIALLITYIY